MDGRAHHDQHRALTIHGKSFCDSACVFCIEKFSTLPTVAPRVDEVRAAILEGAGRYNMLHFMAGEPSVQPKILEHVELAKQHGYRFFGMSSHFRTFADPDVALRFLRAGFAFFDISLHAATAEAQAEVNPIGDGGRSLVEALHGLRNVLALATRLGVPVEVTHKIVITQQNVRELLPIFQATYRLGVRNFILQPVKAGGLEDGLADRLALREDEFMPHVNALLRATDGLGARVKLYGMSQIGAEAAEHLVQEANLIKHVQKKDPPGAARLDEGDRLVPDGPRTSSAPMHAVTVTVPATGETATFDCGEDEFILNAALRAGALLPFGCRMGSCGACAGRVVSGEVDRARQIILTDEQIASGFAVLCRTRPRSPVVVLTHQERELGI